MIKENKISEPIELGIYIEGKSEILKELILLAYHSKTNKIEAIGTKAEAYISNPREDIIVCTPVVQGIIDDFTIFEAFLRSVIKKAVGKGRLFTKPKIEICIPKDIYLSKVDMKAYSEAVGLASSAKQIVFTEQSFEEACNNPHSKGDIVLEVIMKNKKAFLEEQLEQAKAYADHNKIEKEEVFRILKQIYER